MQHTVCIPYASVCIPYASMANYFQLDKRTLWQRLWTDLANLWLITSLSMAISLWLSRKNWTRFLIEWLLNLKDWTHDAICGLRQKKTMDFGKLTEFLGRPENYDSRFHFYDLFLRLHFLGKILTIFDKHLNIWRKLVDRNFNFY